MVNQHKILHMAFVVEESKFISYLISCGKLNMSGTVCGLKIKAQCRLRHINAFTYFNRYSLINYMILSYKRHKTALKIQHILLYLEAQII